MKNPISWFCKCGPDETTIVSKENRLLVLQTQESSKREGIRRKWMEESTYLATKRKNGVSTVSVTEKRKSILEPVFDIDVGSKMTGLRMKIVHIFRTFDDDCDNEWNYKEVTVWGFTCSSRRIPEAEYMSMKKEVGTSGTNLTLAHMVAWYLKQGERIVNNHFATCVVNEEKTTLDVTGSQPISIVDIKDMGAALQRFANVDSKSKRWYAIAIRGIQAAIQRTGAEQKYKLRRRELLMQVVAWVNPTEDLKVMSLSDLPRKTESSIQRRREQRGSFCSENDFMLSESGAGDGSVAQLQDLSPYTPGAEDICPPPYEAIVDSLLVQPPAVPYGDLITATYTAELIKNSIVAGATAIVASIEEQTSSESELEQDGDEEEEPQTAKQLTMEEQEPEVLKYRISLTQHLWLSVVDNTLAATEQRCTWVFENESSTGSDCISLRTDQSTRMYVSGIDPKIVCCHGDPSHRMIWGIKHLEDKVVLLQDTRSGSYLRLNAAEDDSPFAKFTLTDAIDDAVRCTLKAISEFEEDNEIYFRGRDTFGTTTTTSSTSVSASPEPQHPGTLHPQLTKENLALALDDIEGIQCVQSEASPTLSDMLMTSSPVVTARRMEDVGVSTDDLNKISYEESITSLSGSAVLRKGSYGGGSTRKIVKKKKETPTLKLAKSSPLLKVTKASSTPRLTPRVASSRSVRTEAKSPLLVPKKSMKAISATHAKPSSSLAGSMRSVSSTGLSSSTKSISSATIKKLAAPKSIPSKSPALKAGASPAIRPVKKIIRRTSLAASSPSISAASPPITPVGTKTKSSANITDGSPPKKKIIKKKIITKKEK